MVRQKGSEEGAQRRRVEIGGREREREIRWGSGLPVPLRDIRKVKKQL